MRALYAEKQKMEDSVEQAKIDCKEHADKVLEYVEAYKILGIEFGRSLTTDQFKAIYKPLMLKAHPDKNLTNEEQATEDYKSSTTRFNFSRRTTSVSSTMELLLKIVRTNPKLRLNILRRRRQHW